jgi:hypothetical protein
MAKKAEENKAPKLTPQEERLLKLKKELVKGASEESLAEFTRIYLNMILSYAGTIDINWKQMEERK